MWAGNYPVRIKVQVTFTGDQGFTFDDEMAGLNAGHAMWRARQNWADAQIVLSAPESNGEAR